MTSDGKIVVVGAGPVGALAALYAARRSYEVELYELRADPNHSDPSLRADIAVIPLALSERGIQAISGAGVPGLLENILADSRDIYTRMIHTFDSNRRAKLIPMTYGPNGECLHTLQRDKITKYCLLALEKEPTAKLFFNQKMVACDFDKKVVTFEPVEWKQSSRAAEQHLADDVIGNSPKPVAKPAEEHGDASTIPATKESTAKEVPFEFLIGADGTYSSVRQAMMRRMEVDFSQVYCNALWCDLIFPADLRGNYRMDSQCLHVWPADENIVMAQPDFNGSFRAGMVCATDIVRYHEENPQEFATWFRSEFSGIVPDLLSEQELTDQFIAHQKIPLKSIKLNKLGYKDSAVLLGDSSHTMTPFHAMGMITGLEDVQVFFQKFRDPAVAGLEVRPRDEKKLPPFCPKGTVASYTDFRVPDVHAMVDLAHEHYAELRHGVRSPVKRARKIFDAALGRHIPALDWTTLYARIQFGNDRFSSVVRKEKKQEEIVRAGLYAIGAITLGAAYILLHQLPYMVSIFHILYLSPS